MSKTIAIDFGLKRTGLAITDENCIFAFGHDTVDSKGLMSYLESWLVKESVDTIVLGEPKRLNDEDTHISENVRLFQKALKEKFPTINLVMMDERYTSKMAADTISMLGGSKKAKKDKGLIDKVSATIILQSYLDEYKR